MLIDLQTKFSDAQAVTATANSTNVVDLRGNLTQNPTTVDEGLTIGQDFWLVIQTIAAATAAGAATVTFSLVSADDTALSTNATTHWTSTAIGKATLVAGYQVVRLQLPSADYRRYLGVVYTVATGPLTAGSFTAFLTPDIYRVPQYGIGFTVS